MPPASGAWQPRRWDTRRGGGGSVARPARAARARNPTRRARPRRAPPLDGRGGPHLAVVAEVDHPRPAAHVLHALRIAQRREPLHHARDAVRLLGDHAEDLALLPRLDEAVLDEADVAEERGEG